MPTPTWLTWVVNGNIEALPQGVTAAQALVAHSGYANWANREASQPHSRINALLHCLCRLCLPDLHRRHWRAPKALS